MTRKLSMNQAKVVFEAMVGEANNCLDKFIITNGGKNRAILMSFREYEEILESLEGLAEDRPAILK